MKVDKVNSFIIFSKYKWIKDGIECDLPNEIKNEIIDKDNLNNNNIESNKE